MSQSDPRQFWDERFSQSEYYYGKLPNDFLKEQARVFPPKGRLLSLGEGEGRNAVFMAQQGYAMTALDSAPAGLDKTQQLAKEKNVEDRKSTRLNSSHVAISYAVFCLKKK